MSTVQTHTRHTLVHEHLLLGHLWAECLLLPQAGQEPSETLAEEREHVCSQRPTVAEPSARQGSQLCPVSCLLPGPQ